MIRILSPSLKRICSSLISASRGMIDRSRLSSQTRTGRNSSVGYTQTQSVWTWRIGSQFFRVTAKRYEQACTYRESWGIFVDAIWSPILSSVDLSNVFLHRMRTVGFVLSAVSRQMWAYAFNSSHDDWTFTFGTALMQEWLNERGTRLILYCLSTFSH